MSLFRWRGATNTDWATDSNWVDGAGAPHSGGRYPGSVLTTYDDVLFDEPVTNAVAAYNASADEELLSFKVNKDYDKSIADGGELKFDCNQAASEIIIDSQSALQMNLNIISCPFVSIIGSKTGIDINGTVDSLYLFKGKITLNAALTISTNFKVGFLGSVASDVTLTIPAGVTVPATVFANGGMVTNNIAITTLNLAGAQWTQEAGNLATTNITSGKMTWNEGNLTTVNISGSGILDGSNSVNQRSFDTIYAGAKAQILLNNGVGGITAITGIQLLSSGVTIELPPGLLVTYT